MNPAEALRGERVLITGASGSIGTALTEHLEQAGVETWPTDKGTMDVTQTGDVLYSVRTLKPTLIFHLAGAKHAPLGEEDPYEAVCINITGTANVIDAAYDVGARVITASTCKACNPETAYGATKLIAERLTLNAGGSVARFYNVRETCGNVFDIWAALPPDQPLPVTPCRRRFMSINQAVGLLVWAAVLPSGRYTVADTESVSMLDVAAEAYPGRAIEWIPARRGDRLEEPEHAEHETPLPVPEAIGINMVYSAHDRAQSQTQQVAA